MRSGDRRAFTSEREERPGFTLSCELRVTLLRSIRKAMFGRHEIMRRGTMLQANNLKVGEIYPYEGVALRCEKRGIFGPRFKAYINNSPIANLPEAVFFKEAVIAVDSYLRAQRRAILDGENIAVGEREHYVSAIYEDVSYEIERLTDEKGMPAFRVVGFGERRFATPQAARDEIDRVAQDMKLHFDPPPWTKSRYTQYGHKRNVEK